MNDNKKSFIKKVFTDCEDSKMAVDFFDEEGSQFKGKITVTDCIVTYFFDEFVLKKEWRKDDEFIEPTNDKFKLILRDLLDVGYIVDFEEENKYYDPSIVCDVTFFLLRKGMLCIASEYFSVGWSYVRDMNWAWRYMKNDLEPNLRSYLEKYSNKDINLEFMRGIAHE